MYTNNIDAGHITTKDGVMIKAKLNGYIETKVGSKVPFLDIKMQSDEDLRKSINKNALNNFLRRHGRAACSITEALTDARKYFDELEKEAFANQ